MFKGPSIECAVGARDEKGKRKNILESEEYRFGLDIEILERRDKPCLARADSSKLKEKKKKDMAQATIDILFYYQVFKILE